MTRLLLLAALVASPAVAADQFDLVCKGERRLTPDGAFSPVESRYKVDVAAKKWCKDDCFIVEPLASAGADRLVLKQKAEGEEQYAETVARPGGAWVDNYKGPYPPGDFWEARGTCTEAPFTGLKGK